MFTVDVKQQCNNNNHLVSKMGLDFWVVLEVKNLSNSRLHKTGLYILGHSKVRKHPFYHPMNEYFAQKSIHHILRICSFSQFFENHHHVGMIGSETSSTVLHCIDSELGMGLLCLQ